MIIHIPLQTITPGESARFVVNPPHVCQIRHVALTSTDERLEIVYCVQKNNILVAFSGHHPLWTPADTLSVFVENRSRIVALETGVDVRVDKIHLSAHPQKDPCAYFIAGKGEPGRYCWLTRDRHHEETHRFRERCSATHAVRGERCARELHDGDHDAGNGVWWAGEP